MRRALFASALALLSLSCTAQRRAQVLVTIDAEPGVDRLSDTVQVRIWGRGEEGAFGNEPVASEPGTRYPWTVALYPREDDVSRYFRFEAVALSPSGETVATARLVSGYQRGQVLHAYLLLQDSCIGVPCTDLSSTCRNGMCIDIPQEPTFFDPDAGFPDAGAPSCASPSAESCDHMDNDCDRLVDESFDFLEDEGHCGGCDRACDPPHATGACEGGSCVVARCDDGWADCNGMAIDGCEASFLDGATCGSCTTRCEGATPFCQDDGSGPRCVATCTTGTACGGSCVDTQTDELHCGGCDQACASPPFVTASCQSGACVYECDAGRDSCNGPPEDADGCEQDVSSDATHCGSCGNACPLGSQCQEPTCTSGTCDLRSVPDDRSCDADGNGCTDRCVSGACIARACPGGDAGSDAGGSCGGDTCTSGETCCGNVCCNTSSGDVCCGPSDCCTMGIESCQFGSCVPIAPDAGSCGACAPGDCCSDGATCCPPPWECCGAACCDNSIGEYCDGFGSCYFPDAGVPDASTDMCGGSCMTPADCCYTGTGYVCCEISLGFWCSPGVGCFSPDGGLATPPPP